MRAPLIRSIAIINPLADYGINGYSFELAEGLAANGVQVDVYTSASSPLSELPSLHRHRCFPVLGGSLFKQRQPSSKEPNKVVPVEPANGPVSVAAPGFLRRLRFYSDARQLFLSLELAFHLKKKGYDLVWTQWPDIYGLTFWRICKMFGIKTLHTVHNVLPHEEDSSHVEQHRRVYDQADLLCVHSEWSKQELLRIFPEVSRKILVAPLGIYTVYSRRADARHKLRRELNIGENEVVCLICGGIRPYKNVDSVLVAMTDDRCEDMVLIISGQESGFPGSSSGDPLARTRRLANDLGVSGRTRLIPGFLTASQITEVFEAADIVVLPYLKHYGSAQLLLGMTFGKHVVATETGGNGEHLASYVRCTMLQGIDSGSVAEGMHRAAQSLSAHEQSSVPDIPELQWNNIAQQYLRRVPDYFVDK